MQFATFPQKIQNRCNLHPCEDENYSGLFTSLLLNSYLNIARALIHNRSILLVDEGTSALDQKNADIVEESLLQNPDLTLILVSHHLSPERKEQFTKVFELEPVTVR